MKDGSQCKMISGSKDMCGDSTGKKNNESEKTKKKTKTFSLSYYVKHEINALQVKEPKKWYASLKATDGMQHY